MAQIHLNIDFDTEHDTVADFLDQSLKCLTAVYKGISAMKHNSDLAKEAVEVKKTVKAAVTPAEEAPAEPEAPATAPAEKKPKKAKTPEPESAPAAEEAPAPAAEEAPAPAPEGEASISFADLQTYAVDLSRNQHKGKEIKALLTEYGVSSLRDLNEKLPDKVDEVYERLKKEVADA